MYMIILACITLCPFYLYCYEYYNDITYDFIKDFYPSLGREAPQYYKINPDSSTVSLVRVGMKGGYSDPTNYINFSVPVENLDNGREYMITSIGNGQYYLCVSNSEITPNVRRIEDHAFDYLMAFSLTNTINDGCEFDYYGYKAVVSTSIPNKVKIADNGILYLDNNLPQNLIIGKNVKIYSYSGLYTYQSSKNLDLSKLKIYSYSPEPPEIIPYQDSTNGREPSTVFFDNSADSLYRADHMTVYVPYGCREAYAADPEWGKFENIQEMAYDPTSGVEDVVEDEQLGISVCIEPGAICVTASGRQTVSVYAITGMLMKRVETSHDGQTMIPLEPGAYIVKVGERFIRKLVVR